MKLLVRDIWHKEPQSASRRSRKLSLRDFSARLLRRGRLCPSTAERAIMAHLRSSEHSWFLKWVISVKGYANFRSQEVSIRLGTAPQNAPFRY